MLRRSWSGILVAVVALTAFVSSAAAAGTPVKQEIITQVKQIQANPEFKVLAQIKKVTAANAKKEITALDTLKALYTSAGTAVAASTATTTAEKTARKDWVSAVKTNATGIGYLASGLQYVLAHNKYKAQTDVDKGIKLGATANLEAIKAYKLLGIHPTA